MQALMNIELFKMYGVKKILTCCPHDYNTFKNEYSDLGGNYEVIHHSQFLANLTLTPLSKLERGTKGGEVDYIPRSLLPGPCQRRV